MGRITRNSRGGSAFASEGRLSRQNRFQQAEAYAREAAETQPIYTALAQNTPSRAYTLALSDWLHAPVIQEVIRQRDSIFVDATDNVLVTKVMVTISDEEGQILEQGEADLIDDAWWEYETDVIGNVLVEVWDLAGNVTRYEAE